MGGEYPKTIVSFLMVSFLLGPSLCSSSLLVCNNPEEALWSAYPSGAFHLLEKLQISKMCASLIIGKSALEIFRSKIKLRCHFKQPIKRNGFLSSGHPNMITKINHHKRNLFLSFFSTNAFLKNTPGHQKSYTQCLKPVLILILKQQLGWYHIYGPPQGF